MRITSTLPCLATLALLSAAGFGSRRLVAQSTALVTFTGVVMDGDHAPLSDAELGLERKGQTLFRVRSGSDGRFTFTDVPPGTASIMVRRMGFRQLTMDVDIAAAMAKQPLQVAMVPVATDVEAVTVEASSGRLREFTEHRRQSNFGHFFDQNEIRAKSPRYTSELFRMIPGAVVLASPRNGNIVRLRGCEPRVWIDGVRAENTEIDDLISPSEIAGIEIYPSFAGIPSQYMDRENRACGVVIVWTRQY